MKILKPILILSVFSSIVIYSCKDKVEDPKPGNNDKCASKTITLTATVTPTLKCKDLGALTIKARGSSGFTYQLGTGSFQTDSVFENLFGGSYTITVKDVDGCTKTQSFTVTETGTKGTNFTKVESLIGAKCNLACHTQGTGGAIKGIFATPCDIVNRKAMIKTQAYDGSMGNLDANEKNTILTWINAGGGYTD